ncbi:MAG: hypothetical protein WBG37_17250 [Desulfobacterales bacterium]
MHAMAKVINLKAYRNQALDQRIYGPWVKRFGERYDQSLTLPDLSAKVLFGLALPGDPGSMAYYELIMGILDLGPADHFHFLDNDHRMRVVDTHLFLADQVRFELMYRLSWITRFGARELPLVQMVLELGEAKKQVHKQPPQLAASHPEYAHYQKLVYGDKEAFLRRMLPAALEAFQKQL